MTHARGFTLIEMAIVLVIITILIGGLAMPLSAQIQARRIAETNKTLEEAKDAIIGYAMSNTIATTCECVYKADTTLNLPDDPPDTSDDPDSTCPVSLCPTTGTATLTLPITRHYLPCPDKLDDGNPATTNDGDGKEEPRSGGDCPASVGYLPWVTLGTAAQDAWGNRLLYAVTPKFSNSVKGFDNTDSGSFQICNASANAGANDCTPGNVAANVPVVLLSYGPNGWGARNINGATLANPSSNDEKENANTVIVDKEFVSRSPSKAGDAAGEFDDLVRWISADQLRGRICPAGGCP